MAYAKTGDYQPSKRRLFGLRLNGLAAMIAAFRLWRRTRATRRAIADLTPDQLNDIGQAKAARPPLDTIKAVLITNLMSMR